jgi:hypothetical protein
MSCVCDGCCCCDKKIDGYRQQETSRAKARSFFQKAPFVAPEPPTDNKRQDKTAPIHRPRVARRGEGGFVRSERREKGVSE